MYCPYHGNTPYQAKFEVKCKALNIPFGSKIEWLPQGKKMKKEGRQFGKKTREGIFAGYKCNAGGGWTGAYFVIDAQRFQNKPANIRAHLFTVQEV